MRPSAVMGWILNIGVTGVDASGAESDYGHSLADEYT